MALIFQTIDEDECRDNTTHSCDIAALCTNTKGTYECSCNSGYEGDGYNCTGKALRCIIFSYMISNEYIVYIFLTLTKPKDNRLLLNSII